MNFRQLVICWAFLMIFCLQATLGRISTRCFVCRSRGEHGDCRDPFPFNDTSIRNLPGLPISVTSCPSGWCQKQREGIRGPADDYGSATDRTCLSQAPNDGEERCAEVKIRNKVTQLCLCRGDLCNSAHNLKSNSYMPLAIIVAVMTAFTNSLLVPGVL